MLQHDSHRTDLLGGQAGRAERVQVGLDGYAAAIDAQRHRRMQVARIQDGLEPCSDRRAPARRSTTADRRSGRAA